MAADHLAAVESLEKHAADRWQHANELLPHLERLVDVEQLAWGGSGKAAAVARDVWWYPVALPRRARIPSCAS